jgi:hypothetical protein
MLTETANTEAAGGDSTPAAPTSRCKGIAICGSHPQTVMTAPFADEGWLIYACSPHNVEMRTLPRWDQWFEVHKPAAHPTRGYRYLRGLEDQARQKQARGEEPVVWMRDTEALPHFPGGQLYPEKEMKAAFCPFAFTSSIAFMLAKAIIDCERDEIPAIGLWGILQRGPSEYEKQRPGTQYFLWEAARRGIKVLAAQESGLFEPPVEDW